MAEYRLYPHCGRLPKKLPHPKAPRHRIILKDPNKSINGRLFAIPEHYLNSMIDWLEEELAAGRIRVSTSNMAAGTWMILKKDPKARPCVVHDYRELNANMVPDHFPLPIHWHIIRPMAGAKIHGKMDLPVAYSQTWMHEDDIYKTASRHPSECALSDLGSLQIYWSILRSFY
jgi:hypothetical protein